MQQSLLANSKNFHKGSSSLCILVLIRIYYCFLFFLLALLFLVCCSPLLPCCSLLCSTCCRASLFSCLATFKVAPCSSRVMPCCLLPYCTLLLRLVAHTLLLLLLGCSRLVALPSFFLRLATFEVVPCSSCVAPCCFRTLLFVTFLHLVVVPCFSCVAPCSSGCFAACTLLLTICCS